jgi:hypothetical protein
MIKSFLTYTSIIEALTGVALIAVPATAAKLLLQSELSGSLEIILAMVGGAAIFSLAIGCWLARQLKDAGIIVKALLFYNFSVASILLYGALGLGFKGPALWGVIIFHYFQTIISLQIILKKPAK